MKGNKLLNNVFCTEHPDEKLNLVCISPHCPRRGLICSVCKNDEYSLDRPHQDHLNKVVPFKYLINSLEQNFSSLELTTSNTLEYQYLKKLEAVRDESLFLLQTMICNLSVFAQKLQESVINRYESSRSCIMYRGQTVRKLRKVIEKAILHDLRKEQKYQLMEEVKTLVGFVKENEENSRKSRYSLDINPADTLATFVQEKQNLKINCEVVEDFLIKLNAENNHEFQNIQMSKKEMRNLKKMAELQCEVEKMQLNDLTAQAKLQEAENKSKSNEISQGVNEEKEGSKKLKMKYGYHKKQKEGKKAYLGSKSAITELDEEGLQQISKKKYLKTQEGKLLDLEKEEQMLMQSEANEVIKEKELKCAKMYNLLEEMENMKEPAKKEKPTFKHFSEKFKGTGVHLTSHGVVAKLTGSSGIVLLEEDLQTCKGITFKIGKLKSHIIVGLSLTDVVQTKHFAPYFPIPLKMQQCNHGIIGVDQLGGCVFHGKPEENCLQKDFSFEQRDIVNLTYSEGILWVQKSTTKKHKNASTLSFAYKIDPSALKSHRFCVYLGGKEDSVRIL